MKKLLKSLICVCFAIGVMLTLSACGANLKGEYSLYSIETDAGAASITLGIEEYAQLETKLQEEGSLTVQENAKYQLGLSYFGTNMKMIFEDGNICKISTLNAEQIPQEEVGTYALDGEDLVISMSEDEVLDATLKDGLVTLIMGHTKLVFKKLSQ